MELKSFELRDYAEALLAGGLLAAPLYSGTDVTVTGLTYDSRKVTPGSLFIVKGAGFREEFLTSAAQNGAAAYLSEKEYPVDLPCLLVTDVRLAMAAVSQLYYNFPSDDLTVFGITGTKGKSTTVCFLRAILDVFARKMHVAPGGAVSSIETYDGKERFPSSLTTPESPDLWKYLYNMTDSGMTDAVVEVSSQALKYGRVTGLNFDSACIINVGLDHISPIEHSDFEDYFTSKLKIYDSCRTACVNADCEYASRILGYIGGRVPVVTFGSHPDDTVYCPGAEKRKDGIYFTVITPRGNAELKITMPGMFNVQNALAATAMAYSVGIPLDFIREGLEFARAEGRMQLYRSADGKITVIVDYAHNEMSFNALFDVVDAEYPTVRKTVIFGCVGGKAQNRREELGKLTGRRADHVIVTEKDCADEPFGNIAEEIVRHIRPSGTPYDVICDREEAFRHAVDLAAQNGEENVILFLGRGGETTQKRGHVNVSVPSDPEITRRVLASYDGAGKKVTALGGETD